MSLENQMFNYCERGLNSHFWAEPLNAVTNAGFLLVGLWGWWASRAIATRIHRTWFRVLSLIVFCIGIGSFLFHTLATRWAMLADVIPIGIFMLAYLGTLLRAQLGWRWSITGVALFIFAMANQLTGEIRCHGSPCLNGSLGYFPALIALIGISFGVRSKFRRTLRIAAAVFALSIVFRSVDQSVCEQFDLESFKLGTHFIWHLLNSVTLWLLLSGLRAAWYRAD